jgi:nickel-type superoxide dismutase maturation protease
MLLLSKYKISGHSMAPKIKNQDSVLASGIYYWFFSPKINDVVVFSYKNNNLVKRIAGIKNGKYFLQGDNKNDSLDSRKFGFILRNQILGKVIYKL